MRDGLQNRICNGIDRRISHAYQCLGFQDGEIARREGFLGEAGHGRRRHLGGRLFRASLPDGGPLRTLAPAHLGSGRGRGCRGGLRTQRGGLRGRRKRAALFRAQRLSLQRQAERPPSGRLPHGGAPCPGGRPEGHRGGKRPLAAALPAARGQPTLPASRLRMRARRGRFRAPRSDRL